MNLWSHRFSQNTNEKLSRFLPSLHRAEILTFFSEIAWPLARWITYLLTMMDTTVFWFDKKMRFGSLRGRNVDKAALKSGFSVARTSFHGKKLTAIFTLHSDITVESLLNNAATFNRVCTLVEFRGIWELFQRRCENQHKSTIFD